MSRHTTIGGDNFTGSDNILIGLRAGTNITTGSYNIGIGTDALADVTTESHVIEIGGVRYTDPPSLPRWAVLRRRRQRNFAEELVPVLREFVKVQLREVGMQDV